MACQEGSDAAASSDFVMCELCTEVEEAKNHCDDCLANFCDRCAQSHKKFQLTTRGLHKVESGACRYDLELELCPLDGQKMSFYCRSCLVRVCPECELNRKIHVMHSVVSLTRHIGQEKEKLLDRLDDVTTKTETISHIPDDIKSMSTRIELKWLERKELVRQEFASLFETITAQQEKLMMDMEEEVNRSLYGLNQLQQDHDALLSTTCQLSDECISAVQNLPRDQFMNTYPQFLESVKELESKVERMESAKDHMPAFLKVPFSLYKEKLHLHKCLQFSTFNFQGIKAREYHRFVPSSRMKEEITVNMLLDTPLSGDLPPSSYLRYNVDIYCGSKLNKKPVWSTKKPLKVIDSFINGNHGYKLLPGNLYMVKIRPIITCTSHQGDQSVEGRTISIVIVTDIAANALLPDTAMAAGDFQAEEDTCHLLDTVYEFSREENLSCTNLANMGDKNNNRRACFRGRKSKSQVRKPVANPLLKPAVDPFLAAPFVCPKARFPCAEDRLLAARTYMSVAPTGRADRAFPFPAFDSGGDLCLQQRYVTGCSFEEARLTEDSSLNVSRLVLFDK